MVTLSSPQTQQLIKRRALYGKINIALWVAGFLLAISAATCAATGNLGRAGTIVFICLFSVWLVAIILFCALVLFKCSAQLKLTLAQAIADAFYENEALLCDSPEIQLEVRYADGTLSVARTGEKRADVCFDVAPLKSVFSFFSRFGEMVWDFLCCYYYSAAKATANGEDIIWVTVCDYTSSPPATLQIAGEGAPTKNCDNSYFIKRGLIK